MDIADFVLSFASPFLPSFVTSYLRTHLRDLTGSLEDHLGPFVPAPVLALFKANLPYLLSAVALYFGAVSVFNSARGVFRKVFVLAKVAAMAAVVSTIYSVWQGDFEGLRARASAVPSVVGKLAGYAGGLGTLAGWWLGGDNVDNLKKAGEYAASYFGGEGAGATGKTGKKKNGKGQSKKKDAAGGGGWESFFSPSNADGPAAANTRSKKKKVDDPKGMFDGIFPPAQPATGARRAGAGAGEDEEGLGEVVKSFVEKVAGMAVGEGMGGKVTELLSGWMGGGGGDKPEEGRGKTKAR